MSAIEDYIYHMTNHAPMHRTLTDAARAELAALRATIAVQAKRISELEAPISPIELAAYRFYLGDDNDGMALCDLFEEMLSDERERYRAAYVAAPEAERTS